MAASLMNARSSESTKDSAPGLHDRVRRIVKADFVLGDRMRRSVWRAAFSWGSGYLMCRGYLM
jgi:hypothetical protein